MNNLRKAAQAALEALESLQGGCTDSDDGTVEAITVWCPEVIEDLRAALAEPQPEPQRPVTISWDERGIRTVNGVPDDAPQSEPVDASKLGDEVEVPKELLK